MRCGNRTETTSARQLANIEEEENPHPLPWPLDLVILLGGPCIHSSCFFLLFFALFLRTKVLDHIGR
jgi:hypothetical protein